MCRGFQPIETELLKIKAFYTHLSLDDTSPAPDYLTLHYLPRISGGPLEVNGSSVRPDSPAFVTLHRVLSGRSGGFKYGSRERVVACEGARFEIYAADVKVLTGIFRRAGDGRNWKMDCKCAAVVEGVLKDAEVSVAAEGSEVMTEKVDMAAAMRRRRRRRKAGCCEMEEIPEVREGEVGGSELCGCSECCGGDEEAEEAEMEMEVEGVRWALDVGIWVVCLGVGYLVCKASSNPKRIIRKTFAL